jgi:hypothetical protein
MTRFDYIPGGKQRQRPRQLECGEQRALFAWVCMMRGKYPQLWNFTTTANGEVRPKKQNLKTGKWYCPAGKRLKDSGMSKGYPDIVLDYPSGKYHGLRIELKEPNATYSDISKDQLIWEKRLHLAGYCWLCCFGWVEAAEVIIKYLGIEGRIM